MKVFWFCFIILLLSTSTQARDIQADSLRALFVHAKTQQERMESCLDLDNYYRNYLFKDSIPLTRVLLEEGIKGKNEYIIADALRKLVMNINRKERVLTNDSVIYYLNIARKTLTGERRQSFITEVNLRHIRSIADWTKDESKVIEELTSKYNTNDKAEDVYFQIERNYALGLATSLTISDYSVETFQKTLRYYERLLALIEQVPLAYGAEIFFWVSDNIYVVYLNSKKDKKAVEFLDRMMELLKKYEELPGVKSDKYQNFEFVYSLYYWGMSHSPLVVGYQKAYSCLKKMDAMYRKRNDLIALYFAYKSFYRELKDYKMEILYGDSIVGYYKQNSDVPSGETVITNIYKEQAECFAALNDYKKAYGLMQENYVLQEKITDTESKKLRADMDARYDLNYLELEKERLTSRNRQVAILSILFILVLSVAWGISQRYHLQKLKRMQKKLIDSNQEVARQSERAQESEKMKTAFINSMCHEIRTPLNAINGFSSLLLDESIDAECKEEFPELIQKSTDLLTQLVDGMLEVSNLSSSTEELPLEEASMQHICIKEMDKLKSLAGKGTIHYCVEVAPDSCNIRTNISYLSQTIAHLLDNANKFTDSGKIALTCQRNAAGQMEIRVTDTGCGIPADKREWIFERFTKIDDFKPGTGLGLYICRLIVKRLGGTIQIDSRYEEGTSFLITLPDRVQ